MAQLQCGDHPTNQLHADAQEQSGWAPAPSPSEVCHLATANAGGKGIVGSPRWMEAKPRGPPWGKASPSTACLGGDAGGHAGKTLWFGAPGTNLGTSEHFSPIEFSGEDIVLDCSPPTCRICSFARARVVRQNFCLL